MRSFFLAAAVIGLAQIGAPQTALSQPAVAEAAPQAVPAAAYDAATHQRHGEAYAARRAAEGDAYEPRTELRTENGAPRFLNRLILEASPYLRQHAHNPVDWRPWGPAALAEAVASGKPIFLSVGYATCHWCHVMEAESFDTLEVAAALNRDFIPIKVDREERPDVDETYMLATMLINGSGGWPNSVWLTPQGEPFFAGTYFPKDDFLQVLAAVAASWRDQRETAVTAAAQLGSAMRAYAAHRDAAAEIDATVFGAARRTIVARYNSLSGGFSQTAQFPLEVYLDYLLDRWRREGDDVALGVAGGTLDAILAGALHDHAGGGFHRYTVDPGWTTPHFEKMLYNQAQLARALIAAWEATGEPRYRRGAERALDYALREMRAPDGGFYAAEDADSLDPETGEKQEGAFYLWRAETLAAALGDQAAQIGAKLGVGGPPRLEAGSPLLVDIEELDELPGLDAALESLRRVRAARPRPLRDEKVIAGWNGLMIRALAEAAAAFDRPDYAEAADAAAQAVWRSLWREDRLLRFAGSATPAALEDYAWLGLGLLALWDLDGGEPRLRRARLLADAAATRFGDDAGRLKMSETDGPLGPVYQQDDGATPAGESAALELFAKLARRERSLQSQQRAEGLLAALSGGLVARPAERVTALQAAALHAQGEAGPRRALSNGVVRVSAARRGDKAVFRLALREGWHLNAHQPLEAYLIPTALEGETVLSVDYPGAKRIRLGFSETPLAVLEGQPEITAALRPEAASGPVVISLTLQACSDEICLAPEKAAFRLGPPPRGEY